MAMDEKDDYAGCKRDNVITESERGIWDDTRLKRENESERNTLTFVAPENYEYISSSSDTEAMICENIHEKTSQL